MLFGIGERKIAAHQQQNAHYRHFAQLTRVIANGSPAQPAECEHENARNQEADRTHKRRRNLFYGDVDAEISRSPEEIDEAEGERYRQTTWTLRWHGSDEETG